MQFYHPSFKSKIEGKQLVATGVVQPTALSRRYRIKIEYESGCWPIAFVVEPALRPREPGGSIPHVYPPPPALRPCLFVPGKGEWTSAKVIATTIVPWLALWLFYYEVWHATGTWAGGGEHPPAAETEPGPDEVASGEEEA